MDNDKRLVEPAGSLTAGQYDGQVEASPQTGLSGQFHQLASSFGDPSKTSRWLLLGLLSSLLTLAGLAWLVWNSQQSNRLLTNLSEMRVLSQEISRSAAEAAVGGLSTGQQNSANSFAALQTATQRFQSNLSQVGESYGTSEPAYMAVAGSWKQITNRANLLLNNRDTILRLRALARQLAEVNPEMQSAYNDVVIQMSTRGYPTTQIILAKNQVFLLERIQRSLDSVLAADNESIVYGNDFSGDANTFLQVLNGQIHGGPDAKEMGVLQIERPGIANTLKEIQGSANSTIGDLSQVVLSNSSQLNNVRGATGDIIRSSRAMLDQVDVLSRQVSNRYRTFWPALLLGLGLLGLGLSLARLFLLRSQVDQVRLEREAELQRIEVERRTQEAQRAQEEMDRNQGAILRLLDELGDLADGDLTVNATVSEDFTGAIADSVNFAIDQLRILVSAINSTAMRVAESSQQTQAVAMSLAEASEHQAQEIASASAAINEMAVSIDQVSTNAMESSTVAERSVQIAASGAEVVNRTIEGMDTIRGQIQETSKRIKRLGESSQEIGDIVSLINDIADQTNILALNAAIQASMAGEAGRGFAVVADEVQRLAERSANATRQIEGLVKTIQSDTNEAVISMEQTTAEVVRGASLAQDAGVALDKIQGVSRTLADLIANISNAARQQAASAGHISNTMNVIQEITTQTTNGTISTARSVGELADMAVELRERVSGFTLPDEHPAM